MTFHEFIQHCVEHPLSKDRVAAFCFEHQFTRPIFLDACSRYIAHGYANRELGFTFCDGAINNLVAYAEHDVPEYTWSVFLAFDNGEYYHATDPAGTDPKEKYTNPQIAEIIRNESAT